MVNKRSACAGGQGVLVTEVMKMQIAVPIDRMVKALYVVKGNLVNPDEV